MSWAFGAPTASGQDPEPWLRAGVELIDESTLRWLGQRRFLYDLAVLGPDTPRELLAALAATQPQAARVALADLDGLGIDGRLGERAQTVFSEAGIAPPVGTN